MSVSNASDVCWSVHLTPSFISIEYREFDLRIGEEVTFAVLSRKEQLYFAMLPKKDSQMEPYVLEDMISDLQTRRHSLDHEDVVQDPVELLKQRERDLVLAAELGKALLERNQELTKQAEALAEEYSTKLEVSADSIYQFTQSRFTHQLITDLWKIIVQN